ncbi:uncharacterized protein LOC130645519 [Hydractinia symbiolongicarpus]|uniref:uncharacterized protein LOC130645519 n=1 Tax=Hydractinia symbiolongicarpus TaxID=13093 RepID=UPI00254B7174|nr:uncharacterized protein LOC130645519 [Hydractinia symbiolongicarpus]
MSRLGQCCMIIVLFQVPVFLIYFRNNEKKFVFHATSLAVIINRTGEESSNSTQAKEKVEVLYNEVRKKLENVRELNRKRLFKGEALLKWWKDEFKEMLDVMKVTRRERYQLLLIVSTAPQRADRRQAIRQTWWQQCQENRQLKCIFFTDGLVKDSDKDELKNENRQYGDLFLQPISNGMHFGERLLYQLQWAILAYDFDYLVRIDDDHFLCLDVLLYELQHKVPKTNAIYGWIHCQRNLIRPDEGFVVFSEDVVYKFLSQPNDTMICHPVGDQQIALWIQNLKMKNIYYHDARIHHDPPAARIPYLLNKTNVCHEYISLHGSYPKAMKIFWDNRGDRGVDVQKSSRRIQEFKNYCNFDQAFDFRLFQGKWRYNTMLCSSNSTGSTTDKIYKGRE